MALFVLTNGADNFPQAGDDTTGDDQISGLGGADLIHGGTGNDLIEGGDGIDSLYGDADNDALHLGPQPAGDFADGGSGNDTVWLNNFTAADLRSNDFFL